MMMLRLAFPLVLIISFLSGAEGACTVVNPTDVVFVVDNSGSICDTDPNYVYLRDKTCNNWVSMLNFMINIISQIQIDPSAVMVGMVIFQTNARVAWTLDQYPTKDELTHAISNLAYVGGETSTTLGIRAMRTQVFTQAGDRPGAANVAVVITDGNPTNVSELSREISLAQAEGITIVSVGITSSINENILKSLSSPPQQKDYNYFMSPDFQSVDSIYRRLAIITFCPSEAPQLDQTTTTTGNPCVSTPLFSDICFVVDASGSICDTDPYFVFGRDSTCNNWKAIIDFMKNLVRDLTIGPNANRVAVVIFYSYAYVAWTLDRFIDQASLLNAIDQLRYDPGGDTATTDGLMKMRTEVFGQAGDRPDFYNMAITVTDGRPTIRVQDLPGEISNVQNAGIVMYAIGVTNSIDENTLMKFSSPPQQKDVNYFMSPDFNSINVIKSRFQNQVLCPSTTPQAPIINPCVNSSTVADIGLVIDTSGSICDTDPNYVYGRDATCSNFENLKNFLKDIIQTLNVSPDGNRVALVQFSSYATLEWRLDRYMDSASQMNAIDQLRYVPGGDTATTDGLMKMRTEVFGQAGDRPGVKNTIIITTDGKPTIGVANLQDEINTIQALGIRMVAIGITTSIDEVTLKRMSSPPQVKDQDYFMTPDFNSINTIKNSLTTQVLCPSPATQEPILLPTTTLGIVCPTINKSDVAFVVDNSGSICDSDPNYLYPRDKTCNNWQLILNFIRDVIIGLPIGPNAMRVGLVTFHSYATVQFTLDRYTDQSSLLNAVNQIQYVGGETATADGLRKMRTQVLALGDRPNSNKVGIVITDGHPNIGVLELPNEENANQQAGINVVAVGITNQIDESTLKMIGSPPHQLNLNYYMSTDYSNVNMIRENLIRSTFCPT